MAASIAAVETQDLSPARQLEDEIHDEIQRRTNGSVRTLAVTVHGQTVLISGRTSRFYYKQLATSAVLDLVRDFDLENEIVVEI